PASRQGVFNLTPAAFRQPVSLGVALLMLALSAVVAGAQFANQGAPQKTNGTAAMLSVPTFIALEPSPQPTGEPRLSRTPEVTRTAERTRTPEMTRTPGETRTLEITRTP